MYNPYLDEPPREQPQSAEAPGHHRLTDLLRRLKPASLEDGDLLLLLLLLVLLTEDGQEDPELLLTLGLTLLQ